MPYPSLQAGSNREWTIGMEGTRYSISGAGGVRIGLLSAGEGPPLLLVHGGVGQIERWAPVWDLLARSWRVTAMDRRGRGSSGDGNEYRLEDEYGDVAAAASFLAAEAGGPIDVFGHSFGATCTLGAAAEGGSFRRIVVYEPPGSETVSAEWVDRLSSTVAEGKLGRAMVSFLTEIIGLSPAEVEVLKATPPDYDILGVLADTLPREGKALLSVDVPAVASKVSVPVLLLLGQRSPKWAHDISVQAAAAIPESELVVLPDLGHEAIDAAPQLVARELERFLTGA